MSNQLLNTALACIKSGVSIIPIDHKTKKPAWWLLPKSEDGKATWKPFQLAIADEATVRRWFASGIKSFAVVCGKISGGLLVLDFDAPGFYERWTEAADVLAHGLPVQQTGGGGFQMLLRCPDPGSNDKLAWALDAQEETGRTIAIETRGAGGYAVVAPSLHPSGNQYKWLGAGTVAELVTVTQAHANKLLAAARELDEAPFTVQEQERIEAKARAAHRHASNNGQASVIDAFNRGHSIDAILEGYGYSKGKTGRYIRPGGKSESVSVKGGRSYHWSSNDPLNDGEAHDAFDVFTHFDHASDVKSAVKAAARMLRGESADSTNALDEKLDEPWPDPLPLPSGLPPVMPFDETLLPSAFAPWVADIAERMQCPPDYIATTAMIAVATLIGRKVGIRPKRKDDWQVVPNLWGINVGRPSVLKSPAMKEALGSLTRLEIEAKAQYAEAMEQHEVTRLLAEVMKKTRAEALKKAVRDGTDAESIAKEMASPNSEQEPVRLRYMTSNTTVEKLGELLRDNANGVLIYSDELIGFLRSMDREGHESDRGFYLTAWDGDKRYTYDRIGRGTIDIEAACVSIVGSIQPGVLHDYLRAAITGGAGDDGLIQRFQLSVWPDPTAPWRNVDRYPDADAKRCAYDAFKRLANFTAASVCAQPDRCSANVPYLRFEDAAQDRFDSWRNGLENRLCAGEEHPAMEAHLAKYRSLIPSLALIIHLTDGGRGPVTDEALDRAIRWGVYLETHARRLYASVIDGPGVAARELGRRIMGGDVTNPFAARDIYRKGWTGLDRESAMAAIDVLVSLHWIEERTQETSGRPKVEYVVNPKLRVCS